MTEWFVMALAKTTDIWNESSKLLMSDLPSLAGLNEEARRLQEVLQGHIDHSTMNQAWTQATQLFAMYYLLTQGNNSEQNNHLRNCCGFLRGAWTWPSDSTMKWDDARRCFVRDESQTIGLSRRAAVQALQHFIDAR